MSLRTCVRLLSSLPVRPASRERLDLLRAGADRFRAEAITRCLSLRQKEKHMKESRVCLAVKTREKRRWQLSTGWLMVKCCLFLALSPSYYLKNRYWRSVWEGGAGGSDAKKKGKSCLYPANTVFPRAVLKLHRGTSLCLCFVSVISVPFSIITWQLVPPGGGFWLLIYLFGSGIGFFFQSSERPSWTSEPIYAAPPWATKSKPF